jgi:hypothetical protein
MPAVVGIEIAKRADEAHPVRLISTVDVGRRDRDRAKVEGRGGEGAACPGAV